MFLNGQYRKDFAVTSKILFLRALRCLEEPFKTNGGWLTQYPSICKDVFVNGHGLWPERALTSPSDTMIKIFPLGLIYKTMLRQDKVHQFWRFLSLPWAAEEPALNANNRWAHKIPSIVCWHQMHLNLAQLALLTICFLFCCKSLPQPPTEAVGDLFVITRQPIKKEYF